MKTWRCKLCGWRNSTSATHCKSCDKPKPRAKKEALPRHIHPHQCILLALDTADQTGWSVRLCGGLVGHGQHRLFTTNGIKQTTILVDMIKGLRGKTSLPIVVVSERSWGGRMGTGRTCAFGYWLHALLDIGVSYKRFVEVYPTQWRKVMLPAGMATAKRAVVRAIEQRVAREAVCAERLGEDEAPAILIGLWGEKAGEVGVVL